MLQGEFFDGKSAKSRVVSLRSMPDVIIIDDPMTQEQFIFKIDEFDLTVHQGKVNLTKDEILIIVSEEDFQQLSFSKKAQTKDLKFLFTLASMILLVLITLFLARDRIIATIIDFLPDSFLANSTKAMKEDFKKLNCLNHQKQQLLDAIIARVDDRTLQFDVYVIPSKTVNAFAFPGNLIVIHDQLLKELDSPEALAGIVAHELAHIQLKHHEKQFIKTFFIELTWGLIFQSSSTPEMFKVLARDLFTQEEEQAADEFAAKKLREAKISSRGTINFFSKMNEEEPSFFKYLRFSHPQYPNRIKTFTKIPYISHPMTLPSPWENLKQGCQ